MRASGSILNWMSELDDVWSAMLAKARENAAAAGRGDVAEYLDLKASNDLIRQTGVDWLFQTLIEHASVANRVRDAITIERIEPHSFSFRGANIVGASVSFRYGVRCLTVEAGWTRTPADGFMRGGGLAFARFRHFGRPQANLEAAIFGSPPVWKAIKDDHIGLEIHSEHLERHIDLLVQD